MGRRLSYRPGSWYRVDDRTGFPQRAERTRKEWTGLIVDESVWEARQPQDLVRGVKDDQTVPDARPLAPNTFVGPLYIEIEDALSIGAVFVPLESIARLNAGDPCGIVMGTDSGDIFRTTIAQVTSGGVILAAPMPNMAASGNLFVDYAPGTGTATPTSGPSLDFSADADSQYLVLGII
jgi:hypothetical protein